MCMCGKPTINGEPGYSWDGKSIGVRPVNPPQLKDGEELLYDEPGRCGGTDSHCHHFRLVRCHGISLSLLVRHGGGDERIDSISNKKAFELALSALDSNGRYWIFCAMHHAASDAASKARQSESARWQKAAANGTLKTRKQRGRDAVKVWIEQPLLEGCGS